MRSTQSYIIAILWIVIVTLIVQRGCSSSSIPVKECDIHITQQGQREGQPVYTLEFPDGKSIELLTADEIVNGFMSGVFDYSK